MALRMMRRRHRTVAQEATERVQEAARQGLELAAEAAEAVSASVEPRQRQRRGRRVGYGVLGLLVLAALAAAVWAWRNRHRDADVPSEPAPSEETSDRVASTQADAPAPSRAVELPVSAAGRAFMPASETPSEEPVVAHAWAASEPAASAVTPPASVEAPGERAPRGGWNHQQRDVPLFVLPLRPTVPFRAAAAPAVGRARLPGTGATFAR